MSVISHLLISYLTSGAMNVASPQASITLMPDPFAIERDQTNSLFFLNGGVQRAVIDQERKENIIPGTPGTARLRTSMLKEAGRAGRPPAITVFGTNRIRKGVHELLG